MLIHTIEPHAQLVGFFLVGLFVAIVAVSIHLLCREWEHDLHIVIKDRTKCGRVRGRQ